MAGSFNGIGTTYYGERDFRADGSYVTTEWLIFVYFPILPIRSLRVLEGESSGTYLLVYSSSKTQYGIIEKMLPNPKQVASVYAYVACFLLVLWSRDIFGKEYDLGRLLPGWTYWFFLIPYALIPTALRFIARKQMWRKLRGP